MKATLKVLLAAVIVLAAAVPAQAGTIFLTPSIAACGVPVCLVASGPENSGWSNPDNIPVLYKANRGAGEEGAYATSYATSFSTSPAGAGAIISYTGAPAINSAPVWAYIKDGNADPNWYLYNITGWNGTDTIDFSGYFVKPPTNNGGIPDAFQVSHVTIYGYSQSVPDGGSVMMMLGAALMGLAGFRRFVK